MRFLFLITHYDPVIFGAELFAKQLAEFLVKKGHEVDLVTGRWETDWPETETINGVRVYRVSVLKIRYIQTIASVIPMWLKARKLASENRYDFVHAHIFPNVLYGHFINAEKRIITIQGGDLADYKEIYGLFASLIRPLIAASLKQYDRVHAVSTDLRNQIKALSNREAVVIPNGVELGESSTKRSKEEVCKQYSLSENYPLGFSSSRLTPKNNLIETIKAIKILKDQGRGINLLIAGSGYQENELRDLIQDLGIEKQVKLLGSVQHERVLELVSVSDFFIRVSTHEGFGIAALEALATKTPVVSSRAGGLSDFITDENAWVPKSLKASEIAATIEELLQNKELAKQRQDKGFKMVEESYQWNTVLERFIKEVYKI